MGLLANLWSVMLELAPWLLLGAAMGGLLHGLLPPGFIRKHLDGRGGVVKAVLLGVPLPLCSCGVIPAGLSLRKNGASAGSSVGFLIATPQTGVDSILVSGGFLGWPFAFFKVAAALVTGLVGGWFADAVDNAPEPEGPPVSSEKRPGARDMLDHSIDLVRMIWRWLVFGIVVSALISTFIPTGSLATLTGGSPMVTLLGVLLLSVPLYVCATASVPIAAALVGAGLPAGAALVFLMAGPATNVATMGAVMRAFGPRLLAVYLSTIIVGSMGAGLVFDGVIGGATAMVHGGHDHTAWWAVASAAVLSALFIWFAAEEVRSLVGKPPVDASITVGVEGMTCGGCAKKLERALLSMETIQAANVDLEGKQATVSGTSTLAELQETVRQAGFQPV